MWWLTILLNGVIVVFFGFTQWLFEKVEESKDVYGWVFFVPLSALRAVIIYALFVIQIQWFSIIPESVAKVLSSASFPVVFLASVYKLIPRAKYVTAIVLSSLWTIGAALEIFFGDNLLQWISQTAALLLFIAAITFRYASDKTDNNTPDPEH